MTDPSRNPLQRRLGGIAGHVPAEWPVNFAGILTDVEAGSVSGCMSLIKPGLSLQFTSALTSNGAEPIHLTFASIDDFLPSAIMEKLPRLSARVAVRNRLVAAMSSANSSQMQSKHLPEYLLDATVLDSIFAVEPEELEVSIRQLKAASSQITPPGLEPSDAESIGTIFVDVVRTSLFQGTAPLKNMAAQAAAREVRLEDSRAPEAEPTLVALRGLISDFDSALAQLLNKILGNDEFRRLEGTWRGLHALTQVTSQLRTVKVKILDIKKSEIETILRKYPETSPNQTPIFKAVYEDRMNDGDGDSWSRFFRQISSSVKWIRLPSV